MNQITNKVSEERLERIKEYCKFIKEWIEDSYDKEDDKEIITKLNNNITIISSTMIDYFDKHDLENDDYGLEKELDELEKTVKIILRYK